MIKRLLDNFIKKRAFLFWPALNVPFSNILFSDLPFVARYNKISPLCEIMIRNGSDKSGLVGKGNHNYGFLYHKLFSKFIGKNINILEMGIGATDPSIPFNMGVNGRPGASLRAWRDYFINADVYGLDIDKKVLFHDDKIITYFCDQSNPEIIKETLSNQFSEIFFDIIIDDGLHEYEPNITFLENVIHKLKPNGYYIIEDVRYDLFDLWNHYINKNYSQNGVVLKIPNRKNRFDNNLVLIKKV
jgi:SAM-dependent methyltransferase